MAKVIGSKCHWICYEIVEQCDQIWRNFVTLAKLKKILGNYLTVFLICFRFNLIGKFSLLLMAKYSKNN